jgi:hypothetical protein
LNTDVKGGVEYGGVFHVDYCVGDTMFEYYCDDGVSKVLELICDSGCYDNRCLGVGEPASSTKTYI